MKLILVSAVMLLPVALFGQEANPTQRPDRTNGPGGPNPIFKVEVVSRSIQAVSYRNHDGWTKVDFQGTSLAPLQLLDRNFSHTSCGQLLPMGTPRI